MERMKDLSGCCEGRAPVPATAPPLAGAGSAGDARSASPAARPGRGLWSGCKKKEPARKAPARVAGRMLKLGLKKV